MRPSDHDRRLIEDDAFETRIEIEDRAMDQDILQHPRMVCRAAG